MNRTWPFSEIDYPESDGQPMGETPLHQSWMIRLLNLFQQRYVAQPQVYVACNMMMYYTPGSMHEFLVPDLVVLLDSNRRSRRVLKLWEETQPPNLVLEVTSRSTRDNDTQPKKQLYAQLGIAEYFLFDPSGNELTPALQGYRLTEPGVYAPIAQDSGGRLRSEQTGIMFSLAPDPNPDPNPDPELELLLHDTATGERLLTEIETERQGRLWERRAKLHERRAKEQEQQRRVEAERLAHEAELRAEAERAARLQEKASLAELEAELRKNRHLE